MKVGHFCGPNSSRIKTSIDDPLGLGGFRVVLWHGIKPAENRYTGLTRMDAEHFRGRAMSIATSQMAGVCRRFEKTPE
ncbi:hypothetical protein [Rhizobium leguminosarum]